MGKPIGLILFIAISGALVTWVNSQQKQATKTAFELTHVIHEIFEGWAKMNGKSYPTPEEKKYRLEAFKNTLKRIEANRGKFEHIEGLNSFSDLTEEEYAAIHPKITITEPNLTKSNFLSLADDEIPESVDWRAKKRVTEVRELPEGEFCRGSAYAFAAAAAAEFIASKGGDLKPYSAQQIIDCSEETFGCKGGNPEAALDYIIKNGLSLESEYPWANKQNEKCQKETSESGLRIVGYKKVRMSSKDLKAAVSRGVVVAAMASPMLRDYKEGIFSNKRCGSIVDHTVLIVGYGVDPETKHEYWIIKNNMGKSWGIEGYLHLRIGEIDVGYCGINRHAYEILTE